MSHPEFMSLIAETPIAYFVTLIITLAVYLVLFRKHINSVFDPFFVAILYSAFAGADVMFLWLQAQIDAHYFLQFIFSEAAFFIGMSIFRRANVKVDLEEGMSREGRYLVLLHGGERQFLNALYIISAITFVLTQAITYAIRGIPIFYESRLEYYSVGGGIGTLDRILNVTWFFSCYLLIYRHSTKAKIEGWPRLLDILVGVALIASAMLSGSKSTFLAIVFAMFYFRFLHRGDHNCDTADKVLAKLQKVTVVFAIAAAVFVICVQGATTDPAVWIATLSVRFASFGDVFFMAYPSHIVDSISGKDGFFALFGTLLATFRLVPYDAVPESIGFVLHRMIYGFDSFEGPNARHNVFGLIYFGQMGSVLYSLIIGMVVSFVRNRLPAFVRPGSAVEPLFVFFAISCVGITGDLVLVMKDVGSIILVVPTLYGVAALVYFAATRQRQAGGFVEFEKNCLRT